MSVLRQHVRESHRAAPPRASEAQLATWHARQHHRYWCNHWHEGSNTGPDDRPEGWRTGEGAVPK